jgi:TRAP-type mannitol/chloroaromatic compound transport system substrate-binding protein
MELIVNKERWNALSEHQRSLIEGACLATLQATLNETAKLQADALAKLAKEGVKIQPWPEDVLTALRAAWGEIAKEQGNQDYFFRTVLDDIEKFREKSETGTSPMPNVKAEPPTSAETESTP